MKKLFLKIADANPFLVFIPFLALYVLLVIKLHSNILAGDEPRYIGYANNLLHGFYSPAAPNISLWSGPGYPLFLMPFIALKLPTIIIALTNALLQYLSIILLYYALLNFAGKQKALLFSFFWAMYYVAFQEMPLVVTETFSSFIICLLLFLISNIYTGSNKLKYVVLSGIVLGFLALTKIIFGYVLLVLLIASLVYYILNPKNLIKKRLFYTVAIALLLNLPYLFYTFHLTHKMFYWGNSGGMSLYWMSTPVEGEFGDWNNLSFTANCGNDPNIPCNAALIAKNHAAEINYIKNLPANEQDDAYKKIAIANIKAHPAKYARNIIANFGRLFFGFPASYFYQREQTLFRLPPNCILFVLFLFNLLLTVYNFKRIDYCIKFIQLLLYAYIGLTLLVSTYPRQFYIIVPIILLTTAFIANSTIKFKYKIE